MAHLIDSEREGKKDVQFSHLCNIEKERGVKDILKHRDSGSAVVTCENTNWLVSTWECLWWMNLKPNHKLSLKNLMKESEAESEAKSEVVDALPVYISPVFL